MNLDIVISLYKEKNIDWILDIPKEYNIYIYNKGDDLSEDFISSMKFKNLKFKIQKLKNFGRESDTYLHHIIENYNNLADTTIFTQAEPHVHSPDFSKLLENYESFEDFQCLTDRWQTEVNIPSLEYLNQPHIKNKYLNGCKCAATLYNTNQIYPILYKDTNIYMMLYSAMVALEIIPNKKNMNFPEFEAEVIKDESQKSIFEELFKKCGLKINYNNGELPAIYYFCISACFGVKKNRILQNSLESYKKLKQINLKDPAFGYLIERSWAIMFGPIYNKKMLLEDLKINNLQ